MRSKILALFLLAVTLFSACTKDEELTFDLDARLSFSADTILFDTVFTSVGSTSRRLKVFNHNSKAIHIEKIRLAGGANSAFSLNISGIANNETQSFKLNGKDSMNVFVKVNINPTNEDGPFIVQDTLHFEYNGQKHAISLLAYGQNAIFINGSTITEDATWSGKLPYIIYRSVTIAKDVKLTVKPGTKILFHGNSTMSVIGTLSAIGSQNDTILFASDRLEKIYANESGQWNGIHFYPDSRDSEISYAIIKNGVAGITLDSVSKNSNPKLLLTNSIVKNMEVVGILGYQTEFIAINNLFYNCGQYLLYGAGGGGYNLKQNTFVGHNPNFARRTPAVYLSDYISGTQTANLSAEIVNNIIWGNLNNEMVIEKKSNFTVVNASVKNNLLKSIDNSYNGNGNMLNVDPKFINVSSGDFRLGLASPANNHGLDLRADAHFNRYISRDLQNKLRLFPSELGCYENN